MPRKRSKDPLTAATTSVLLPALRPHDFKRVTPRIIGKVTDDIFQFFNLQLAAFGGKDFCVNYASMLLSAPHDSLVLTYGDRLRDELGVDKWRPADTHASADVSMAEVVGLLEEQTLPFFQQTETRAGFLEYLSFSLGRQHQHHDLLNIAACAAALGQHEESVDRCRDAVRLYEEDGRSWCAEYIGYCRELINAVENGTAATCLMQLKKRTVQNLRLEKLVEQE